MTGVKEDVLVRDENYVKYDQLLAQAESNGRLYGRYRCLVCGMRYLNKEEAEHCCRIKP